MPQRLTAFAFWPTAVDTDVRTNCFVTFIVSSKSNSIISLPFLSKLKTGMKQKLAHTSVQFSCDFASSFHHSKCFTPSIVLSVVLSWFLILSVKDLGNILTDHVFILNGSIPFSIRCLVVSTYPVCQLPDDPVPCLFMCYWWTLVGSRLANRIDFLTNFENSLHIQTPAVKWHRGGDVKQLSPKWGVRI